MIQCLLVSGDTTVRDIVRVGLEQTQAFEVETAEDRWALQLCRATPYDVVVADTTLGDGSDGVELLRQVREICPGAEFMLITRSKTQSRYLSRDKQEINIASFLTVPITATEFFRSVKRLMERCGTVAEA